MNESCLNIGDQAPAFTAATTFGPVSLSDYQGKWVILFSHPGDFTPVCTTEFIAFAKAQPQFEALNAQLLGLSIDSSASHLAWCTPSTPPQGSRSPSRSLPTGMGASPVCTE